MAGSIGGQFKELISPFLRGKLDEAAGRYGVGSPQYLALARQYITDPREVRVDVDNQRDRHYHSEQFTGSDGNALRGVERLYRRTGLMILTTACKAHCRWCLRGQYDVDTLSPEEIRSAAKHFGSAACRDDVREILITGGDPLMARVLVECAIAEISRYAPNVEIIRIGTRMFMQDPARIDDAMVAMFKAHGHLRFEIGTHFNHPVEFWPETVESMWRLQEAGVVIYNQHPLLKGVNDSLETLDELYDLLRGHAVESHYLFHCVPMFGMNHHRTSVSRGLTLINRLTSSGAFSGRAKPHFAAMTDIGKVSLYEGTIVRRNDDNEILLQTGYRLDERMRWNPSYLPPRSAEVDDEGFMRVWYKDGCDDPYEMDRPTEAIPASTPLVAAVAR